MSIKKDINEISEAFKLKNNGIKERSIRFYGGFLKIFFVKQLIDGVSLTENIIKPLVQYASTERTAIKAQYTMENVIYAEDSKLEQDQTLIEEYLLDGYAIILFSNEHEYIAVNIKKVEHRAVAEPEITYTLHSPRDCFVENLDTNISLLRYRIKDKNIRIEEITVGERTKSRIVLSYLEDVVNPETLKEIRKRINDINIEAIIDSGEVHNFLLKKNSLFPQMGIIERSDLAAETLLEGKVVIMVDGSNLALSAPKVMAEFLYSCDDRYDNKYFTLLTRLLRYFALLLSISAAATYVAIISFHNDVLPVSYILALAQMRSRVPWSALVGVLILEFVTELIRECLLRVPKQIGPAIGIVGAIIIGQAAVAAGWFSPVLLILISIEFLASFAIPDFTFAHPFRILKLFVIIMAGMAGYYGLTLSLVFILTKLVSTDTFGIPYMAPFAPLNRYDFKRAFIFNKTFSPKRQQYMRTKDGTRTDMSDEKNKSSRSKPNRI